MKREIEFRPAARADLKEAVDWYERQSRGLGADFLRSIEAAIFSIVRGPAAYPVILDSDIRRALTRKFPYSVIYSFDDVLIIVFAIFHAKRDPIIWKGRVG